ncbi:MAG: TIGR01459 family HAD-type hydrolase [Pseudorhodobacter sp.]
MTRFADLVADYDGFILDQYGVLHDGTRPYPGVAGALELLKTAGKPVTLLTNSGRTAGENADRLGRLGIDPAAFRAIVTSGDLAARTMAMLKPEAVFVLARGGDALRTSLPVVADPAQAGFLLIAGSKADTIPEETYRKMLLPLAEGGIPALCSNPDLEMLTPLGLRPGAGQIAQWYMEMGGEVQFCGKPWPEIYHAAVAALDLGDGARICCIGDSLHHDILGANRAGLDSALMRTGVSAELSDKDLARLTADRQLCPTHLLAGFG